MQARESEKFELYNGVDEDWGCLLGDGKECHSSLVTEYAFLLA